MCIAALLLTACGRIWFDPREDLASPDANNCGHTFCDNFERVGAIEDGWDSKVVTGTATVDFVESSSKNLAVTLPMTAIEAGLLRKNVGTATTHASLQLRMGYASTTPGTAEIDLVRLQWNTLPPGCSSFGYFLVRDGTGPFNLQETYGGCGGNVNDLLMNLDNSGMHAVKLDVTFGAVGAARVALAIDGTTVFEQATSHAIEASQITLEIGGDAVRNMAAPWTFTYDDVFVDLE